MENKVSIIKAFNYGMYLLKEHYRKIVWPVLILGFIESVQIVSRDYVFLIPLLVNFLRVSVLYSIVKYMLNLTERKNCNWLFLFLDKEKYINLFYYSTLVFIMFKSVLVINNLVDLAWLDKGLLIVVVYLWIRFYFTAFFIVDHGVDVLTGLKLSYQITTGFLFKMSIFLVVFILVNLTGIIIIIIGRWLVTYPLLLGVSIYIYQKLIDNSNLPEKYKSKKSLKK